MGTFVLKRLSQTIVVIFIVSVIVFTVMHLIPGDPVRVMLGDEATEEQIELKREELGLNDPLPVQYVSWLGNVLKGDLGRSIAYNEDVSSLIAKRLPITAYLGLLALSISLLIGIPLGIIAAIRRGGAIDSFITILANLGLATPIFWLAILGIYFFSLYLGWLPVQGFTSPFEDLGLSIKQTIMPAIFMSVNALASMARQTRSAMLEVIRQDYIRTARSKGLKERTIIIKHGLKNAFIPIITILGIELGPLIGGSVLIEQVFNIPGIGRLITQSIFGLDFIVVQGCIMLIAVSIAFANLAVDISYGFVDPRIRDIK